MVTTKKLLSSQLRINMVSGTVTTVINTITMAVGFPIYLHFLGYEKYGVWLVLATVLSFAQLGDLGIGQAITKLVAEEYGRNNIEGIQHYVTTALASLCISGTVALIVIVIFKSQITAIFKLSSDNATMVSSLLPYIAALSIYVFIVQVLGSTLSGLGRMDLANYIQALSRLVGVTAAGVLLYRGLGVVGLLIGNALSYLFNHILAFMYIRRTAHLHLLQRGNLDTQRCKRLLRFGGGVFGCSLINMLFSPFNKLMLSRYAGVAAIPIYEIAFTVSMQVRGLIESGFRPLMPEISRLNGITTQETKNRIIHIYRCAIRLILSAGIPVYSTLALAAPVLLKLWLGAKSTDALPSILRIMLVGTFLSLLCVPAYYTLMGLGRVHQCFLSQVIQGVVNAGVVGIIILFAGTISIRSIASAVVLAMGVTSFYVVWQNRRAMRRFQLGTGRRCVWSRRLAQRWLQRATQV